MANGRNRSYSSAFRVRGASSPRSNEPLRKPSHAARQRQLRQHNPAQARLVLARSVPARTIAEARRGKSVCQIQKKLNRRPRKKSHRGNRAGARCVCMWA
eukprot:363403-Chlamydomonas_euryale.AAC.12